MDDDDIAQVTLWFTEDCPQCENSIMVCDGETEVCPICEYSRTWDQKPGSWDADWHVTGLA